MKISVKLSSVIIFFLVSVAIGVGLSYSKVYLFHLALVNLLFYLMLAHTRADLVFSIPRGLPLNHLIFFLMITWYALSILWSVNRLYTLRYLFYLFCGLVVILTMVYYIVTIERQNRIFRALAVVFIIEIILCLLEVFTPFRLPISPFSPFSAYFGRSYAISQFMSPETVRYLNSMPTGFHWNPNNLAVTMVILLPFFLFHRNKLIALFGFSSILAIVVAAGSRGTFIAFAFVTMLWGIAFSSKRAMIALIFFLPLIIALYLNLNVLKGSENKKIAEMASVTDVVEAYLFEDLSSESGSIGIRKELIRNGVDALIESNGLGVGGGGSQAIQERIGGVGGRITSMHNFWVEIFVDSGFMFGVSFIAWYVCTTMQLYLKALVSKNMRIRYYCSATSLSLIGFFIAAMSASSVIYLLPMWLLFGFSLATLTVTRRTDHSASAEGFPASS